MRLIDKDALLKDLGITNEECDKCAWGDGRGYCTRGSDFRDACDAICTAIERKTGKWLPDCEYDGEDEWYFYTCSCCDYQSDDQFKYCPSCGADMREQP